MISNSIEAKNKARAQLQELVKIFKQNEVDYLKKNYNETQVRTDFISPLLEIFGWDIYNKEAISLSSREVIEEATIEIEDEKFSKKPDYELRVAKQRKLFLEAKKPNVNLETTKDAAFQARRYGYSGSLPIVVLTNFYQIAVYDCQYKPNSQDHPNIARLLIIKYEDFDQNFDQLWLILSRSSMFSGDFDKNFSTKLLKKGSETFDIFFLNQVRSWRKKLALDIYQNNATLSSDELTYAVQIFLLRIIFLRICEDRDIEKYQNLKKLSGKSSFTSFMKELKRADEFYDSGLFRLIDDEAFNITISDNTLNEVINELYYPLSPYTFAVVETEVLGEIYEQFLGESIIIKDGNTVDIIYKPEVKESGGVVPTPRYIVDTIVENTLNPLFSGKSPAEVSDISISDICCGSGVFLLSVFDYLLNYYLDWYTSNSTQENKHNKIYESINGLWKLNYAEKRRILLSHIRGVDIDNNAVEVARFSLLLKLIENESAENLQTFVREYSTPALPELDSLILFGNSLVSHSEWVLVNNTTSFDLLEKVNPFEWNIAFQNDFLKGGFNVIVGNPPYIRIQNMTHYSPEEVNFYKNDLSPYTTARQDNFDKYYLFIERSIQLTKSNGRLGFIIPNKFMSIKAGTLLRTLLLDNKILESISDFGVLQVFGNQATNYTCLVHLNKSGCENIKFEKIIDLDNWKYSKIANTTYLPMSALSTTPWSFQHYELQLILDKIKSRNYQNLIKIADIFVGLQTSADSIYIFKAINETSTTIVIEWNNKEWEIEKAILKPFIHKMTLQAYTFTPSNNWLIFPYSFEEINGKVKARLIQPDKMLSDFPLCYEYLLARKAELEKRKINGGDKNEQQFYQFGRSQSLTQFDKPKIVFSVLSKEARYTYDDKNIMMTGGGNGPYYSLRASTNEFSDFVLLALLHHPLIEALIKTQASTFRDGYYSHSKQFMEQLPVPHLADPIKSQIEKLCIDILDNQKKLLDIKIPHKQTIIKRMISSNMIQIENIFSQAFELPPTEIDILKKFISQ
ncbi:Eco57I restriction-modification methylase domain-containing protein [Acinetobacter sp. ANC 3781]